VCSCDVFGVREKTGTATRIRNEKKGERQKTETTTAAAADIFPLRMHVVAVAGG